LKPGIFDFYSNLNQKPIAKATAIHYFVVHIALGVRKRKSGGTFLPFSTLMSLYWYAMAIITYWYLTPIVKQAEGNIG